VKTDVGGKEETRPQQKEEEMVAKRRKLHEPTKGHKEFLQWETKEKGKKKKRKKEIKRNIDSLARVA
jgi:hypothetical protein